MKKLMVWMLAALLALALCACGGKDEAESSSASPSPSPSASPSPKASPSVKPKASKKPSSSSRQEKEEEKSSSEESSESSQRPSQGVEGTPPPGAIIEPADTPAPDFTPEPPESTPEPIPSPPDISSYIGGSLGAFTSVYGAPTSSSYTSSSMGTGEDGILAIGGYTVYTYRDETGYEYIVDIG